jgi:hypothetical protein
MSYIISPIVNCSGIMNFGFDNPCIYLDPLASSIITGSLVGNLATACLLHITRYYKLNRSLKHNLYSFKRRSFPKSSVSIGIRPMVSFLLFFNYYIRRSDETEG